MAKIYSKLFGANRIVCSVVKVYIYKSIYGYTLRYTQIHYTVCYRALKISKAKLVMYGWLECIGVSVDSMYRYYRVLHTKSLDIKNILETLKL